MPRARRAGHRNNALPGPAKSHAKKISRVRGARLPFIPPSSRPSRKGTFRRLPPEIRHKIYALVFVAGHTALRSTSRAMLTDTRETFHRHGVYRLHIVSYETPGITWPYIKEIESVENVEIHIHPPVDAPYHEYKIREEGEFRGIQTVTRYLAETVKKPRSCCVKFTMATYSPFVAQTLEAIKCLRRFERIEVQIYNGAWSVKDGIRRPGRAWRKFLYRDEAIIEDVKRMLFSNDGFGNKSGVTVVQVKKHIRFNR